MKSFMPRTVTGQLITIALVAFIISQAAMIAIIVNDRQRAARQWWTGYILSRIASVVELLDRTPETMHLQVLSASDTQYLSFEITPEGPDAHTGIDETAVYLFELRAMIPKQPGKVLVDVRDIPSSEIFSSWLTRWRGQERPQLEPWLEASVQLDNGKWLNLEVAPLLTPPSFALLLIPVATMLAIFGSAIIIIIRYITRPIKDLADAADAFGRGEEVKPVSTRGPAEIRQAIEAFNNMRERLSRFVLDRTKMLAAVGHDLRTPITTMRLRAEFIDDEETRNRVLSSLEEMQQMTEAALRFAKEEAVSEPTKTVDLNALVQTVCSDQADMSRDVSYQENSRLLYRCRPNSLKRAVRNLVENAVIHGKSARVALNGPAGEVWITVDDAGPGIPEHHMNDVFTPFVRLDESRGQETGGIGLGLAIARSIVRGHGGDIQIANKPQGGLRATVRLPVL